MPQNTRGVSHVTLRVDLSVALRGKDSTKPRERALIVQCDTSEELDALTILTDPYPLTRGGPRLRQTVAETTVAGVLLSETISARAAVHRDKYWNNAQTIRLRFSGIVRDILV